MTGSRAHDARAAAGTWGVMPNVPPTSDPEERDGDDSPVTPLDEPPPEPIEDPPAEPGPQGPYVVGGAP